MLPNLESILFAESIHISEEEEDDDDYWQVDPKPSLPRLKSIKFKKFEGEPLEINVIKFFLLHARFLETVTIVVSPWHPKDHEDVKKLLLTFPKPAHCVVKFLMSSEDT
ncbi:hypothetical protein MKX03_018319 [Papaver bracteatum]|nr:hypothetical protein MKX03_018319 [Papaver bracteatum]